MEAFALQRDRSFSRSSEVKLANQRCYSTIAIYISFKCLINWEWKCVVRELYYRRMGGELKARHITRCVSVSVLICLTFDFTWFNWLIVEPYFNWQNSAHKNSNQLSSMSVGFCVFFYSDHLLTCWRVDSTSLILLCTSVGQKH